MVLRPTGAGRVHLVHAAGGPLGGDDLARELALVMHANHSVVHAVVEHDDDRAGLLHRGAVANS